MANKIRRFAPTLVAALVAGGIIVFLINTRENTQGTSDQASIQTDAPRAENKKPEPEIFNKARYSLTSADSLWFVANKKNPVPQSYVSRDLTPVGGVFLQAEAARNLSEMIEAAKKEQVNLKAISGYRSYAEQQKVYNSYVAADGQAAADTYSARPGHSEHQTGLAADLGNATGQCDLEVCFETTPAGVWLAANAYKYGFVIRYGKDKTPVTGYQFEPWHIRYVGKELAGELKKNNQTMEEFFGLPAAPVY